MKNLFFLLLLALSMSVSAQVGINTDGSVPDNSAMLDVKSTTKGVLIPRMTLAQRIAIASPANGLMIYQTDNTPGFYYNSGIATIPAWVMVGAGSSWGLTGNSGTVEGTNFIGTTDDVPVTFKLFNQLAGKIEHSTNNTSLGYLSFCSNTTGNSNTAFGTMALYSNTDGYGNTANGRMALFSNTYGISNTAYGRNTLFNNTYGNHNTALGSAALYSNTTGYSNVAIGTSALKSNTTISNLVAIGDSALFNNGIGADGNTAVGSKALYSNSIGSANTAVGFHALYFNLTGSQNNAYGVYTLYSNTEGSGNTACGPAALYHNNEGDDNTASGWSALYNNTTGNQNTANGNIALLGNSTGNFNTAIGFYAMPTNTDGNWNTCIGEYTNTSVGNLQGASSFGASAITTADNKIVIGASVAGMWIGGYVGWSTISDGRFKEDIKEDVPGLAFISQLRPVTYWINTDKLQRHITAQMPDSIARHYLPTAEEQAKDREYTHTGFVAQEVEATAKAIGYDFDGVNAPKNPTDNYSIAYSQFVPSLVKAVQELKAENEELKVKSEELRVKNEQLTTKSEEQKRINDEMKLQITQLIQRIEKLENK
jgi:trimeric autotransporter adhesin